MKYSNEQINEVSKALELERDIKVHKKLQVLLFRMKGKSLFETRELTGANGLAAWRVCKAYAERGLEGLRCRHAGGNRKLTLEQETAALAQLEEKAAQGVFVRVAEVQVEYELITGTKYRPLSFCALLRRHGWRKVMPRGRHPKAANEETCEAVKKLTLKSDN